VRAKQLAKPHSASHATPAQEHAAGKWESHNGEQLGIARTRKGQGIDGSGIDQAGVNPGFNQES
jgi:hypothetical protein